MLPGRAGKGRWWSAAPVAEQGEEEESGLHPHLSPIPSSPRIPQRAELVPKVEGQKI